MSRIRAVNERAVEKTISFLEESKFLLDEGRKFNSTELQEQHEISKSTFSICRKLHFIKGGKWVSDEPTRLHALQILEVLRQQASKRIDVALSSDFETAIERLTTSMNILSTQHEKASKGTMLGRALNQAEQNPGNTLFSKIENDESKKFELLKSIASGYYSKNPMLTHEIGNDWIMTATEDLFNKFFAKK